VHCRCEELMKSRAESGSTNGDTHNSGCALDFGAKSDSKNSEFMLITENHLCDDSTGKTVELHERNDAEDQNFDVIAPLPAAHQIATRSATGRLAKRPRKDLSPARSPPRKNGKFYVLGVQTVIRYCLFYDFSMVIGSIAFVVSKLYCSADFFVQACVFKLYFYIFLCFYSITTTNNNNKTRTDGRHPDGFTPTPWQASKPLTWDVTVVSTLADSYVHMSSQSAGGAAEAAASRKTSKYADLPATHTFQPLAFETHGTTHSSARDFLNAVGGRSITVTGDPRDTTFLWQRISVLLQRFSDQRF